MIVYHHQGKDVHGLLALDPQYLAHYEKHLFLDGRAWY